jgi:hypothetical protein
MTPGGKLGIQRGRNTVTKNSHEGGSRIEQTEVTGVRRVDLMPLQLPREAVEHVDP